MNPKVLKPAEVAHLLRTPDGRTAQGRRDAALLAVMAGAGLRLGEAVTLPREALQGRRLVFAGNKQGSRYGSVHRNATRIVTLPDKALRLVRRYAQTVDGEYLFPGRRGGHLSPKQGFNVVKDTVRAAGLPDWIHPHSLRHSFATALVRSTGDLFMVQKLLGHSSPEITARYYLAFDERDADRGAEALNQVFGSTHGET